MADILSLSKARKARIRAEADAAAAQNRLKFGRTKADKLAEKARTLKDRKGIDGHRREP